MLVDLHNESRTLILMLSSLTRILTIALITMGVSAPLVSANVDGAKSPNDGNQAADSVLTFCLSSHPVELCRIAHWHGSNQLLTPDSPRPQAPEALLNEETSTQIPLIHSSVVSNSVVYSELHTSLPALYLTTLRLRL